MRKNANLAPCASLVLGAFAAQIDPQDRFDPLRGSRLTPQ